MLGNLDLGSQLQKLGNKRFAQKLVLAGNYVLKPFGPFRFRIDNHFVFAATVDRVLALWLKKSNSSENFEIQLWKSLLRPGMIVVDAGANLGIYSFIAAQAVGPQGKVYAFEPDPLNADLFELGQKANCLENISCNRVALSDRVGSIEFGVREEHHGDSKISVNGTDPNTILVPTTTLDDFFSDKAPVDLIKFDIQGGESLAIRGLEKLLARNPHIQILSELAPKRLVLFGMKTEEYLDFWRSKGFEIYYINEDERKIESASNADLLKMLTRKSHCDIYLKRLN